MTETGQDNASDDVFGSVPFESPSDRDAPFQMPTIIDATAGSDGQLQKRPTTTWWAALGQRARQMPASRQAIDRGVRVRRVTRVVRHVDPWSVFKVAILLSAVAYVVLLTAGVLLWRVADSTGTLDNVERWFTQFGWETFELNGGQVFAGARTIGLFAVVAATGCAVLLVTVFNLVSDIIGGVRVTVLEEEVVEQHHL